MKNLGMPYMGSKRKLAAKIVDKILKDNPNTKYVYDLFGGGGAISFEFLQRKGIERVIYNELNTGVVELLRDVVKNGVTEKYYQWIDRETFKANKDSDTWFGGLCKVVWSFGNKQKDYLFGKQLEEIKRLGHEISVNKDENALAELSSLVGVTFDASILGLGSIRERRLALCSFAKQNRRLELQQLQQLERLERLEQLEIYNLSYKDVLIITPPENTIIYLDPPYEGTTSYQKSLDYTELYKYISELGYKVYLSSYKSDLKLVESFLHRQTLGSAKNGNPVIENLYTN